MFMLDNIIGMLKLWLLYTKVSVKGSYLWLRFRGLQAWYFIFTPKGARYIEDVPLLDKARRDLDTWYLMATSMLFMEKYMRRDD